MFGSEINPGIEWIQEDGIFLPETYAGVEITDRQYFVGRYSK